MKRLFGIAALLMVAGYAQAEDIKCDAFIRMHGMVSRAQFQCGFNQYNNDIIAQASLCGKEVGEQAIKPNLMAGMKRFDALVAEMGQKRACAKLLRDFPMVFHR